MDRSEPHAIDSEIIVARMDGTKVAYTKGQIVYSQGDPAGFVFYVSTDILKVAAVSEEGRVAVFAIHRPGHFLGEKCLGRHNLRTATATALTECTLVKVPKARVICALHDDQEFSELFSTYLMHRNIRMQADLVDHLLHSTEMRLARALMILADYGEEKGSESVMPKIPQETLAEMIGASRTHVNFFMNKFRQLGIVEYDGNARGGIKVSRSFLNALLYEKPQIAQRDVYRGRDRMETSK